ncbi:hypothetical protein BDA96_01G280100 [Sorghum bicolor]|uniref:Uncharacterized protein n=1 Tax=Sorghum bicolor TaxID=4558 RepID=A0A921S1N3_SORBI|nr:hypothetical protein BDA96_01G280100 [Sorghum bicolor]
MLTPRRHLVIWPLFQSKHHICHNLCVCAWRSLTWKFDQGKIVRLYLSTRSAPQTPLISPLTSTLSTHASDIQPLPHQFMVAFISTWAQRLFLLLAFLPAAQHPSCRLTGTSASPLLCSSSPFLCSEV